MYRCVCHKSHRPTAADAAHYLFYEYTIIEKFSNLRHLVCAVSRTSRNYV
jgi:hypothetical protein